ncbi:MAG: VOC family protein [Gemmobacter sp.]
MDLETVAADDFGRSLSGLGLNLLTRDVRREAAFLVSVFGMTAHRVSADFAILRWRGQTIQLHADATYHAHPLPGLLPESGPRGAGAEFRLFGTDPDAAAAQAEAAGGMVLQAPADKPHGLREAFLLSPDGYCWVPGVPRRP